MINLKNINKSFKDKEVLKNLTLDFPDKGLFLLTGDNGIGKTTLLYILGLLDISYSGEYILNRKKVSSMSKKEINKFRQQNISFLFSKGNLIPYLTIKENLELEVRDKRKIINFIPKLDLNSKVYGLSGGEEILLALSHEIALEKRIYLMDEVTSALDDDHCEQVMKIIDDLSKNHLVIMTSHDERAHSYGKIVKLSNVNRLSDN